MPVGQIVNVADELGHRLGTYRERAEELGTVGSGDLAEKRFLVAEVSVEALLAGLGDARDAVYPGAGEPECGELGACGAQNLTPQLIPTSHSESIAKRTGSFGRVGVMAQTPSLDAIMNPPRRVLATRRVVDTLLDRMGPLMDLYRPYVDGLENLPRDGRFLLVGNHTQGGGEVLLIPYFVRREIGSRVRPLAERRMGDLPAPMGDLIAAYGAVIGSPESASELMRHDETILVFPGGGREIAKFKGEENTLRWQGRAGFARVSVENGYPIVPVALIGGDDVYRSLITRTSLLGQLSLAASEKLSGTSDMAPPLMRGIGPTLIPRPQRMYLRFAPAIDTTKPARTSHDQWVAAVREKTQESLERAMADLLDVRSGDPYRELNPLAWRNATLPAGA